VVVQLVIVAGTSPGGMRDADADDVVEACWWKGGREGGGEEGGGM